MAPPIILNKYLYRLDDIEKRARYRFGHCSFLYLHNITLEYCAYFKWLTKNKSHDIHGAMIDALHFYFKEKLRELFISRSDIEWIVYEYDQSGLFPADHQPGHYSKWIYK